MQGLALIDYDNVCGHRNRSKSDFEPHTEGLVDAVAQTFRSVFPSVRELDLRLYGGWLDERGDFSPAALSLFEVLPVLRRRRHGLIVRPSLATTLVQLPDLVLQSTVRLQARRRRQKMVDGMLGCDAMSIVAEGLTRVGVITDDDDLLPATLSAHAASAGLVVWMPLVSHIFSTTAASAGSGHAVAREA